MDREAWHAAIHGVAKSRTRLNYWTELIVSLQNKHNFHLNESIIILAQLSLKTWCSKLFITYTKSTHLKNIVSQSSHSVVSESFWPHRLQQTRLPYTSPTPRTYSNSSPSCRWCHPTISPWVVHFSSRLQSFPASVYFQMSQLFVSGGQHTGVSASASVLTINIQDWFPLGWTGWISLQSKGLSRLLQNHSPKASILQRSAFFTVQISHPYMTTGQTIALARWTFARVQPQQDPGVPSGWTASVRERWKTRETSLDRAKSAREREREREREWPDRGVVGSGRVWQIFIFYCSFIF